MNQQVNLEVFNERDYPVDKKLESPIDWPDRFGTGVQLTSAALAISCPVGAATGGRCLLSVGVAASLANSPAGFRCERRATSFEVTCAT